LGLETVQDVQHGDHVPALAVLAHFCQGLRSCRTEGSSLKQSPRRPWSGTALLGLLVLRQPTALGLGPTARGWG
jgi:hypothetical protein